MSVLDCSRANCDSVMCDFYSDVYGYICGTCLNEMKDAQDTNEEFSIREFIDTPKKLDINDKHVDLSKEFELQ